MILRKTNIILKYACIETHYINFQVCPSLITLMSLSKKSDDLEIEIDEEIVDKQETSYKERQSIRKLRGRRKNMLAPLHSVNKPSGVAVIQPSFVTDQPNKNQTWLYDTPGIVSDKQVGKIVVFSDVSLNDR